MYQIQNGQIVKIIPATEEQVIPLQAEDLDSEVTGLKDSNQSIQAKIDNYNISLKNTQQARDELQAQLDDNNALIQEATETATTFQASQVQAEPAQQLTPQ